MEGIGLVFFLILGVTHRHCAARRLALWGCRSQHNAAVGVVVAVVLHRSRINSPDVIQAGPPFLPVLFREGHEGEGGGVRSGHDNVTVILLLKFGVECGLSFADTSGEGDGGVDVTLFAHGALKVEPRTLVFKLNFNWHGVVAAQSPVSIAVDLRGCPKKLSILDQTHGVGHHADVLGGNRRVGSRFRNGSVPDANIQVKCQGTPVGDARLTQVGSKEDRRFVSPLQSQPELAVLVGLSVDGGHVNVLIDSGGGL